MIYIGAMKKVASQLAVVSANTVYTNSFPIGFGLYFGLWAKATSVSGTPAIKVELEESYVLPSTEGAADTNYVEPDGMSDIFSNLNDEVAHVVALSPKPMPYGRFKLTDGGSNPADSLIDLFVFVQEPAGR